MACSFDISFMQVGIKCPDFIYWRSFKYDAFWNFSCIYIYVGVNLWNQAICELTKNCRQFVKCLFQSVNLFFYACKTLKPGLFSYAVEREPVRLESTNPEKKSQTWDALWWGAKPPPRKKNWYYFFFWWRLWPPIKEHPGSGNFFLGLVDSSLTGSRSTAYRNRPGFSVLHA